MGGITRALLGLAAGGVRTMVVTNQSELAAAVTALGTTGGVIRVATNVTPYALDLTGVQPSKILRIMPLVLGSSVIFSQVKLTSCYRFYFEGLTFEGNPSGVASDFYMGYLIACQHVTFRDCTFDGKVYTYYSGTGNRASSAMRFENTTNFSIYGCFVDGVCWGIRLFSCTDGTIEESTVQRMQMDGVQFVGLCLRIDFNYNKIGRTLAAPYATNHGDMIQFTNGGNTLPMTDITIRNSIVATLGSYAYQSIFLNDEVGVGYQRIKYNNNIVFGGITLGMVIRSCSDCEIKNNIVLRDTDAALAPGYGSGGAPAIQIVQGLTGLSNLLVQNNASESYIGLSEAGVISIGNTTVTSGQRNTWVPGIETMTDLTQFDSVTLPAGYGPERLQAS